MIEKFGKLEKSLADKHKPAIKS